MSDGSDKPMVVATKGRAPSFTECMRLMRQRDPLIREEGFHGLLPRAHEHLDELQEEFRTERDLGLKAWLVELIGHAGDAAGVPFLLEQSRSSDEAIRMWATRGLLKLNTRAARLRLRAEIEGLPAEEAARVRAALDMKG